MSGLRAVSTACPAVNAGFVGKLRVQCLKARAARRKGCNQLTCAQNLRLSAVDLRKGRIIGAACDCDNAAIVPLRIIIFFIYALSVGDGVEF